MSTWTGLKAIWTGSGNTEGGFGIYLARWRAHHGPSFYFCTLKIDSSSIPPLKATTKKNLASTKYVDSHLNLSWKRHDTSSSLYKPRAAPTQTAESRQFSDRCLIPWRSFTLRERHWIDEECPFFSDKVLNYNVLTNYRDQYYRITQRSSKIRFGQRKDESVKMVRTSFGSSSLFSSVLSAEKAQNEADDDGRRTYQLGRRGALWLLPALRSLPGSDL